MTINRKFRHLLYQGNDRGEISVNNSNDNTSQVILFRHPLNYPVIDIRPTDVDMVFDIKTPTGIKTYYLDLNLIQSDAKPASTGKAVEITPNKTSLLYSLVGQDILVIDGAMGTMIQEAGLSEKQFRGERFAHWEQPLKGCNDVLAITQPKLIAGIHSRYLDAGADIIETNTFNANAISLADYKHSHDSAYNMSSHVAEINYRAARLALKAVNEYTTRAGNRYVWVAGSVGPTGKSLSMSSGIDSESDGISWQQLVDAYITQMTALIAGGVHLLLIETTFDALNAKAAIYAARLSMERTRRHIPIMLSVTLTESGRTLSGQTLDAFVATVSHENLLSIGLNCGFGAEGMIPHIEALQNVPFAVSVHPNAGLPDEMGCYNDSPGHMAKTLLGMMQQRKLNIIGGCCGTTPDHISLIAQAARQCHPRIIPERKDTLVLAGLEAKSISENSQFITIGERCNVAGSRKFLRLIKDGNTSEAIEIARSQVEAGAQIIDINMDDAMLDSTTQMASFIDALGLEPDIAKVPIMIDSSCWETVVSALQHTQGRPIVNSISLKEGEEQFIKKAAHIKEMGAAVVVMAFDEEGQADTFERKTAICHRAYDILTNKVGFNGSEIIFDPNVLAVATGIEQHNNYALDFIRATEWIKQNLPGAKVSGGISNLSFSFRGNNYVREAMHACFLLHATKKGMDMAIVNPSSLLSVYDIPNELRIAIDDVLLNRRPDATERLVTMAEAMKAQQGDIATPATSSAGKEDTSPIERIAEMIVKGNPDGISPLLDEAMNTLGSAIAVIDGPLMEGINRVGKRFGDGQMFLPQVVKSAHAMRYAVSHLAPHIEAEKNSLGTSSSGCIVMATVKGDVHDIGKNIVNVIMTCNGFEIIDMGVMAPAEKIIEKAIETNADFIGLSGLITPSLEEMCNVARLMQQHRLKIPLLIGGATTSELHTAVKIAPLYDAPVVYVKDAASLPGVVQRLANSATRDGTIAEIHHRQQQLRSQHQQRECRYTLEQARKRKFTYGDSTIVSHPKQSGIHNLTFSIDEVKDLINWRAFFSTWKLDPSFASIATEWVSASDTSWISRQQDQDKATEAFKLWIDASKAISHISELSHISARIAIIRAGSHDEEIICRHNGNTHLLPTPRQLSQAGSHCLALADYIKPATGDTLHDWIGMFAVTTGMELQEFVEQFKSAGDNYNAILYQSIADRLAEAATELTHKIVKERLWGFPSQGIRPAIGYPSLPDQRLVFVLDKVLEYERLGITLTSNGALYPPSSTTGLIIHHPDARYFNT